MFSQQPAYFVFGEEQFRGTQIYDVIQDKKLNYWFATNEGLFHFDYYHYTKVECDKAKGSSVFNFTMNTDGIIFCHNLNNQVFIINNNECDLFYELKADEGSSDITLSIADDGNLIVGNKTMLVLDMNGKEMMRHTNINHYIGPAFATKINGTHYHLSGVDSVLTYHNGKFRKNKLFFLSGKLQIESVLKFYTIDQSSFALDLKTRQQYSYDPTTFELSLLPKNTLFERSQSNRVYETGNELWVTGTLPGAAVIDNKKNSSPPIYFVDYFISDVFKDNEGNILLSTFDKGILVIPDTKVLGVISSFRDDPVTALHSDSSFGLMIGTSKGNLLTYNKERLLSISDKGKRPIEALYGHGSSDFLVFDDGHIRAFNKRLHTFINITEASLKDAAIVSKNTFYLGTNRGIIQTTFERNDKISNTYLKSLNFRIYSLEYHPKDSTLYASTANGLFVVSSTGSCQKILYNNEPIFPNNLTINEDTLFATTRKNGVLVIKNNRVCRVIHPLINDKEEVLKKIIVHQNTLVAKSSNGLFQFDMDGKLIKSIHLIFGLSSKRIIDFTIHQNQLWVSHSGGVQLIDLNYSKSTDQRPIIRFDHILVNDKEIKLYTHSLKSHERKIQFIFSSPSLRNRETILYHYKLVGYDSKWNTNPYESNQITYSALAPGDYIFYIKAENQGIFSELITFSFTIDSPFYTRWWFISICVMLFLGVVFMIYRWQLNNQRKKSRQINELNASKLTAIQSQMNPHFIFNSLNSIQDLILKGDVERSYSYITTFSNLVRRTLSYSEKDFVDFEQEIKLLELYLSLEKLRFKKELNYTIDITNVEDIMLPPLLIQPFIENSLIHGLLHKEGQKNLKITFELKDDLICTIEDNGIGREKSKAIKLRQRKEHESFSGRAIHKRFNILSNVFGRDFGFRYEDLTENNEATGTKVILTIPIKHKY